MSRIAIAGPMFSGKTTLADNLVKHHGWYRIGFNDLLKEWAAEWLTNLGVPTTVEDIIANKHIYRRLLQEMGNVIGFNEGFGVDIALERWKKAGAPEPVIFDNVRFDAQFEPLKERGFVLVHLTVNTSTRYKRAGAIGIAPAEVYIVSKHFSEHGYKPEVTVDANLDEDELVDLFVRMFGENPRVKRNRAAKRIMEGMVEVNGRSTTLAAAA